MMLEQLKNDREFCIEIRNEYGEPYEWDLSDPCLNDLAECYWLYKNDEEVKRAYHIQTCDGFLPERKLSAGVRPHGVYNGRYTGLPMWKDFDCASAMLLNVKEYLALWEMSKLSETEV